ncbi:MAG: hypothetical protein AAGA90_01355 [Actinomycetota bacterium]
MKKLIFTLTAVAMATTSCLGSDTSKLNVGECVRVTAADYAFGGDVHDAECIEISLLNDVYRVHAVGSESSVDQQCPILGLVIVDGDDAACLVK